MSHMPGITVLPPTSMTLATAGTGTVADGPTATMRSFWITIVWSGRTTPSSLSNRLACTIAIAAGTGCATLCASAATRVARAPEDRIANDFEPVRGLTAFFRRRSIQRQVPRLRRHDTPLGKDVPGLRARPAVAVHVMVVHYDGVARGDHEHLARRPAVVQDDVVDGVDLRRHECERDEERQREHERRERSELRREAGSES